MFLKVLGAMLAADAVDRRLRESTKNAGPPVFQPKLSAQIERSGSAAHFDPLAPERVLQPFDSSLRRQAL